MWQDANAVQHVGLVITILSLAIGLVVILTDKDI